MELKALIESLRAIADFYEANPYFPLPQNDELRAYSSSTPKQAKQQVVAFLDGAGRVEKQIEEISSYIYLVRFPNGFKFLFGVDKEALGCRKVQHERIVVEEKWECGPLFFTLIQVKKEDE